MQKKRIIGTIEKKSAEILISIKAYAGVVNGGSAYADSTDINSICWKDNGMEYTVIGNLAIEKLQVVIKTIFGYDVVIPDQNQSEFGKPEVEVPIDLVMVENEQKSVDAGHSPWKLDPIYVTQVFTSLLISPDGIVGDYPIQYESIEIIENTGKEAIAVIHDDVSIANRVYLKRLIHQDDTGIWTVVGYDKAI